MTVGELVDKLGGTAAVARLSGVGPSAVSNWRRFGYIPPRLYLRFADAGREIGIAVPAELFREIRTEAA